MMYQEQLASQEGLLTQSQIQSQIQNQSQLPPPNVPVSNHINSAQGIEEQAEAQFTDNQDSSERRILAMKYRSLVSKLEDAHKDANFDDHAFLNSVLNDANEYFSTVKRPYEASLDHKALVLASDLGKKRARNLNLDSQVFDRDEYLSRLKDNINNPSNLIKDYQYTCMINPTQEGETDPWLRIGHIAACHTSRAPSFDFLLGPLALKRKPKKKTINRTKEAHVPREAQTTEHVKQSDLQTNENDTTVHVKELYQILSRVGPINLYLFIINPFSFGQSVENLFYLSFLVKEGKASILAEKPDFEPIVAISSPPTQQDYRNKLKKKQVVLDLDCQTWALLIEKLNISQAVIPNRDAVSSMDSTSSNRPTWITNGD